ncbi:MAG TPA: alpha-1,2-fucosyltransferase, partial [Lachnospiraceae bacterium]|nr:alpha-1,2-fucosyltransferase [Lachnospiraceae bacterium]
MLIIKLMGGLGNQMQQYALCRKLQTLGREARLDISWFEDEKLQKSVLAPRSLELRYFRNLSLQTASAEEIRKVRGASTLPAKAFRRLTGKTTVFTESKMYHPEIFSMDGRYLEGYFACNKYYADILPLLREEFVFP